MHLIKRIALAFVVLVSAALCCADSWFPGYQGFQFSGDGNADAFHLDIQNAFANGCFIDGVHMGVSDDQQWAGSSQWGISVSSHINAMLHETPTLMLDMGLSIGINIDGFSLGAGEFFVVGSVFGPYDIHVIKSAAAYNPANDCNYSAVLDYTVCLAADNSGTGYGTFDVSRSQVPDTGSTLVLFGSALGLLALYRRCRR